MTTLYEQSTVCLMNCPACDTTIDDGKHACPTCGALTEEAAWMSLWLDGYAHQSADPAVHAAHQFEVAARVLRNPGSFDAKRITWARAVLCS